MSERSGRLDHDGAGIAWRRIEGEGPTVIWLGGFRSEMNGTKAQALADWAAANGRDYLRFDYFGHGESDGDFVDGAITRWRGDALAVIDELTSGAVVLVGSSMGGWLACLAALARPKRVGALVLIAPAADFTSALLEPELDPGARAELERTGVWMRPSPYADEGYPITRALLEDGARWTILPGPVPIHASGSDPPGPRRRGCSLAPRPRSQPRHREPRRGVHAHRRRRSPAFAAGRHRAAQDPAGRSHGNPTGRRSLMGRDATAHAMGHHDRTKQTMKTKLMTAAAIGVALTAFGTAQAADGCGRGFHRGPYGHCRPNYGPGVVAPGLAVGVFYPGRGYWDGRRYWMHRERWHGGWRYR